jgi:hypothetical protein
VNVTCDECGAEMEPNEAKQYQQSVFSQEEARIFEEDDTWPEEQTLCQGCYDEAIHSE